MCEPITAATALVLASGAKAAADISVQVVGFQGQKASARHQRSLNDRSRVVNARVRQAQIDQINRRLLAKQDDASRKAFQNKIDAAIARAEARASADAAGITGVSVDRLLGSLSAQEGRRADAIRTNLENARFEASQNIFAANVREFNANLRLPTPAEPSLAGLGLSLVGPLLSLGTSAGGLVGGGGSPSGGAPLYGS